MLIIYSHWLLDSLVDADVEGADLSCYWELTNLQIFSVESLSRFERQFKEILSPTQESSIFLHFNSANLARSQVMAHGWLAAWGCLPSWVTALGAVSLSFMLHHGPPGSITVLDAAPSDPLSKTHSQGEGGRGNALQISLIMKSENLTCFFDRVLHFCVLWDGFLYVATFFSSSL